MDDILFQALKLLIMVLGVFVARYVIPCVKRMIDTEKMETVTQWVEQAVLYAQQVHQSASGPEKKAIVTKFLWEILTAKNISISEEQLNVLIEAAVKSMKMQENAGISIETGEIETESAPEEGQADPDPDEEQEEDHPEPHPPE